MISRGDRLVLIYGFFSPAKSLTGHIRDVANQVQALTGYATMIVVAGPNPDLRGTLDVTG